MVTVSGYAERQSSDGKSFYALILQGDMELVLSEETGRYYATAKQASITSTFDEPTCKAWSARSCRGKSPGWSPILTSTRFAKPAK
jgi:hypothetical protein